MSIRIESIYLPDISIPSHKFLILPSIQFSSPFPNRIIKFVRFALRATVSRQTLTAISGESDFIVLIDLLFWIVKQRWLYQRKLSHYDEKRINGVP